MLEIQSGAKFYNGPCCLVIPVGRDPKYGIPHFQIEPKYLRGKIVDILFLRPQEDKDIIFQLSTGADCLMFEGTGAYCTHMGYCLEHKRQYIRWPVRLRKVLLHIGSTIIVSEEN